jgi:hypothetical protein
MATGEHHPIGAACHEPQSRGVDVDNRLGERLGGLLRQIVTDAACDGPVHVPVGKFLGIGTRVRMWCAIGIALKGDGRQAAALRLNVASSNSHLGEARCQVSFENSLRNFSYPARPRSVAK